MTAGVSLPTTDTANVDLGITTDVDPQYFETDGGFVARATIAGKDNATGDILGAQLSCVVSVIGGVLTVGPTSTIVPIYAPALAGLTVALQPDAANLRVLVRVVGNVGLAGRTADVDVVWEVWGST